MLDFFINILLCIYMSLCVCCLVHDQYNQYFVLLPADIANDANSLKSDCVFIIV
jgi:hypothetical protein